MEKSIHSVRYAVFLKVLRKSRQDAGLSQVQLAKMLGETQTFVSKCERGERRLDVIETPNILPGFRRQPQRFRCAARKGHKPGGS